MAGINAHLKINSKPAFILQRSEAYIGVLIDDLVTKGTEEPYRMFTSRAEYRILLRQDNADIRLTPKSNEIGLASNERLEKVRQKEKKAAEIVKHFKNTSIDPTEINPTLEALDTAPINQKIKLFTVLSRPQVNLENIKNSSKETSLFLSNFTQEEIEQAEILMKYEGYISKEQDAAEKLKRLENIELHDTFNYKSLPSLSSEAKEKLTKIKPKTIGQASRISGISPSDISILLIHLGR
jgi:tRNA uridine 5-carboxymethylaminomethyl modification enzyme